MYVYAAWVRADAVFVQAIEVADTAAGETLEDEYVSLSFKHGGLGEIRGVYPISFFCGDVYGLAVDFCSYGVFSERVIVGVTLIVCPKYECPFGVLLRPWELVYYFLHPFGGYGVFRAILKFSTDGFWEKKH